MIVGTIELGLRILRFIIIFLLLFTPKAFATQQVVQYFTHTPVSVCTPSDSNPNCGGGAGSNGWTLDTVDGTTDTAYIPYLTVSGGPIYFTSLNGSCWNVTVNNSGNLQVDSVSCPGVVPTNTLQFLGNDVLFIGNNLQFTGN